jgi:signal transduction histidine kinase/CheY-like chemotaxis protein
MQCRIPTKFRPIALLGAGVLIAVAGLVFVIHDLRLDNAGGPAQPSHAAIRGSDAADSDAPLTLIAVRDAARGAREALEDAVTPAFRRTDAISHEPDIASAVARRDSAILERIANEQVRRSRDVDAVAFVDADGRLLAVNTVDVDGKAFPSTRLERLLAQDISRRPVVSECLHSGDSMPVLEFQTNCEFTRILWDSVGLSVACSAPVIDPVTQRRIGAVTTRLRFERIEAAVDRSETPGIDLMVVGDDGRVFDENVQRGEHGPGLPQSTLAGLVGSLGSAGTNHASVAAAGHIACAYPVPGLRAIRGGGVSIVGIAEPALIAAETGQGRLLASVTVITILALGALCAALLVQSRQQRAARLALVTARNEADAASRSKTEFLANMSHEIRTPMTAILGYVDLLADHGDSAPNAPSREEAVETIRRNARHLLSLINDVLDLSKVEAGQMHMDRQRVRTLDLVQDALRLMDDRARQKGLALRLILDGDVPDTISTDPTRLRQVLINLLGNAVKFTDQGAVTLTLRRPDLQSGMVAFEVADTGIGMTPEQLSRLYQPFMQADMSTTRRYGGTGLGLAITRRCVDILGGTIAVRSAPGSGTSFTFTIDAGDLQGAQPARLRSGEPAAGEGGPLRLPSAVRQPLSGVRVLLAEDGLDNQRLIRFHLERAGARVDVVDNGAKAVERVQDSSRLERHDVVLMDMQMPVMDGYEAVRRLVAAGERVPIIALTAHAMPGDREKCVEAGCHDYLCKPVDARALIAAIRHAIAPGATECTVMRRPDAFTGEFPGGPAPRATAG